MSTFMLVHGAWAGGWCWDKVVPLLKQAGHKVETLDLPGHGKDKTPLHEITLAAYTKRVCETLDAQAEPVILVGHSMGGIVITQVAEERPEKIQTLVYLSAVLVQNGESLFQFATIDTDSLVFPNLILNQEQGYSTFKEEAPFKELFGADCSYEDVEWAKSLLVPEALAPSVTPVHITEGNYSRVPRVYIETLRDRAVSPFIQKKMYTALPCQKIISMEIGHASFFSAPEELLRAPPVKTRGVRAFRPRFQLASSEEESRLWCGFASTSGQTRSGSGTAKASGHDVPFIRALVDSFVCCPQARFRTLPGNDVTSAHEGMGSAGSR